MTQLMKIREVILQFISRYEIYVMAAFRFVVGFIAFRMIIQQTGYMETLSRFPVAILLALLCCFLPAGVMMAGGAILVLLELYALSTMLCLIVALIILIMVIAYLRLANRKGLYAMLTPVLSVWGCPYAMPVAAGLRNEPYGVIAVICGEVVYFIMRRVVADPSLFVATDDTNTMDMVNTVVNELLLDREMYLYLITFAVAAVVTFCICRLSFRQSHLVAAIVGIAAQIIILPVGEIMLDNEINWVALLVGGLVGFLIVFVMSFFTHNLNYSKIEKVQFEDDDYYYYVKAIPKNTFRTVSQQTPADRPQERNAARQAKPQAQSQAEAQAQAQAQAQAEAEAEALLQEQMREQMQSTAQPTVDPAPQTKKPSKAKDAASSSAKPKGE